MSPAPHTRRDFLANSGRAATTTWIALNLPWLTTLASCARDTDTFARLTHGEGQTLRAFAAQVIPTDTQSPGADEAGAVYFIDRAMTMPFFADDIPVILTGIADLDRRARLLGNRDGFASLSNDQQIAILGAIEHTPFFAKARALVIIGTFGDPSYGGNRHGAGWDLIGIEHRPSYTAPFGWYDAHAESDKPRPAA
jgi:gluconate 2-dehydrogenase gamma chain